MQSPRNADLTPLVQKLAASDHDRFRAILACPTDTHGPLFALFNVNLEIAQAPWASQEPMIAEMRLQWWIDALDALGKNTHPHPALDILAPLLSHQNVQDLQTLITARRWDIYSDPFETSQDLQTYLHETGGLLYKTAADLLGAKNPNIAETYGTAIATANYLTAIPALERAGKRPLYDGTPQGIATLATWAISHLPKGIIDTPTRFACLSGYRTRSHLNRVLKTPTAVAQGSFEINPLFDRLLLIKARYF